MVSVIISEHLRNPSNYILIELPTFQSAASHLHILGTARTEDCNSWSKMIAIILICA